MAWGDADVRAAGSAATYYADEAAVQVPAQATRTTALGNSEVVLTAS